jgi:hypothetical protein
MKPDVQVALSAALRHLEDIAGREPDAVRKMFFTDLNVVLTVLNRQWDGAAATRVAETRELSDLLGQGAEMAPNPLRKALLDSISEGREACDDLRISSLDAALARMNQAAIELHTWLESCSSPEAEVLLKDLWTFMKGCTERWEITGSSWY